MRMLPWYALLLATDNLATSVLDLASMRLMVRGQVRGQVVGRKQLPAQFVAALEDRLADKFHS